MFFESYFNLWGVEGEQKVCCPFPHTTKDGRIYTDHNPSMHINLDKRVYHCPACGAKGNEKDMVAKLWNCTTQKAIKFLSTLNGINTRYSDMIEQQFTEYTDDERQAIESLGADPDVAFSCGVAVDKVGERYQYQFPVVWEDNVADIRTYRPGMTPKVTSVAGACTGLVIPYQLWKDDKRATIICAGEKDMLVARSHGFNAITLTGGEMAKPLALSMFKDRVVFVCYDNDFAGATGATALCKELAKVAKIVKNVTAFHEDFGASDTKEDITDWFTKYDGTAEKLKQYCDSTPEFICELDNDTEIEAPYVSLMEAIKADNIGKTFRTNVQIVTVSDTKYDCPVAASAKKMQSDGGKSGDLKPGDVRYWNLFDDWEQHKDIVFELVGYGRERQRTIIQKNLGLAREKGIIVYDLKYKNMYWARVSDIDGTECDMYFFGDYPGNYTKLEVTYTRLDNPINGECVLLAEGWNALADEIDSFVLDEDTIAKLNTLRHHEGTVADKVTARAEAVRGLLGYECNLNLIEAIDLTYNSVKEFNYGNQRNVRGYIDSIVIGESRVGKSDTAKRLRDAYDLGAFVSLAGSAATIPGIIGGSVKDALGRCATKSGVIPRNNGGLICFEELAKCERELIKSLTDVRSSGLARITRVSGAVEIPASLRMCTLTNVKPTSDGSTRPILSYSSGLEIVKDLIGTAEDIARYDFVYIQSESGNDSDPLYMAPEPYDNDVLRAAIRWVWSRKSDDIVWEDGCERYLSTKAKELNEEYPLHIKLFGTECWKKLCRLSAAVAGYTISTDETFQQLIVTKEHIDWAVEFLRNIYDNSTFKLKEVVEQTKAETVEFPAHTAILQKYYVKWHDALDYLYAHGKCDNITFSELANISDGKEVTGIVRKLITMNFITKSNNIIYCTQKYRITYEKLDRHIEVETL